MLSSYGCDGCANCSVYQQILSNRFRSFSMVREMNNAKWHENLLFPFPSSNTAGNGTVALPLCGRKKTQENKQTLKTTNSRALNMRLGGYQSNERKCRETA
jgi:hypothetical protein